jgi:thioredoxin reductase
MTRREERALLVVGGGLAGLAATAEASRAGLDTVLVEQRDAIRGPRRLIAKAVDSDGEIRAETTAWGIWGRDVALWNPTAGSSVMYVQQVIVATGAFERPAAFPGWTLPGVISAGGARRLLQQGVAPGQRVLVAGYGKWAKSIAKDLQAAGVNVVDTLDAAAKSGRLVIRAEGESNLERVVIARARKEHVLEIDALVLAWGLLPENQLARLAGCQHSASVYLDPCTDRDAWMRTSVPGVLVAGDAGGIRGPKAAVAQGRLAGLAAALDAGCISLKTAEKRAKSIRRRLSAIDPVPPPPLQALFDARTDGQTVLCRCEDVTLADITERIFDGSLEPGPVIAETRATMGLCQGRNCASLLAAAISRQSGVPIDRVPPITPRPPVLPVPLGVLAERPPVFEPPPNVTQA